MKAAHRCHHPKCDVLVIGAGPAGSAAARAAALAGARVIMIDRRRHIGAPAQCAGFLPLAAAESAHGFDRSASLPVDRMQAWLPDGNKREIFSPGFIINRENFDQSMANDARDAGARIMTLARMLSLKPGERSTTVEVAAGNGLMQIETGIVVGADGPHSRTGDYLGYVNKHYVVAAQWTVPLKRETSTTRIFFDRAITGGYGWLFPSRDNVRENANMSVGETGAFRTARVGVGVNKAAGANLRQALIWLLDRLAAADLIEKRCLSLTGGWLPAGGPLKTRQDRIILAGDAAGLCHPLTGAGIWFAMSSGVLAGVAAAKASAGDTTALAGYSEEIEDLFGTTLRAAAIRKSDLDRMSRRSKAEFTQAIKRTWFADEPATAKLSLHG